MKKNPRKTRWTKAFRRTAGKELTMDTSLEFEKKRNVPEKYSREVMIQTLKAMKKISDVQQKRQQKFYEHRMKAKQICEKQQAEVELEKNINLIEPPSSIALSEEKKQAIKEKIKEKIKGRKLQKT